MPLPEKAKMLGAVEDKPITYGEREQELKAALANLRRIQTQMVAAGADANPTGKYLSHLFTSLSEELHQALRNVDLCLEKLSAVHWNDVTPADPGSLKNIVKMSDDMHGQLPVTVLLHEGVDENASRIEELSERLGLSVYEFLPGRIKEKPEPLMPSEGSAPTQEQAWTHAAHKAVASDNPTVLTAAWRVLKFIATDEFPEGTFPPFVMEIYQGAGYYHSGGSRSRMITKPDIFKFITQSIYLEPLSVKQLDMILVSLASHNNLRPAAEELSVFLENLPIDKDHQLNYLAAFLACAQNGIIYKDNIQALLAHNIDQAIIDDAYRVIASSSDLNLKSGITENSARVEAAAILLNKATKPLPAETLIAIAKTGYISCLKAAIEHAENADLVSALESITRPPFIGTETKIIAIMDKIRSVKTKMTSEQLSPVLDHAVRNNQTLLLRELIKMPQVQPLLTEEESKREHPNYGGIRILYIAANYTRGGATTRTKQQLADDVKVAIDLVSLLRVKGAELKVNEMGDDAMAIINRRVEAEAPELKKDRKLELLNLEFQMQIEELKAMRIMRLQIRVQREEGVLPLPGTQGSGSLALGSGVKSEEERRKELLDNIEREIAKGLGGESPEEQKAYTQRRVAAFERDIVEERAARQNALRSSGSGTPALLLIESGEPPEVTRADQPPQRVVDGQFEIVP